MTPISISLKDQIWLPLLSNIFALFLSVIPLPFFHEIPMPTWLMLNIGYWTIIQQRPSSPLSVFLLGIILDALSHCPLGAHAFSLLIVHLYMQRPSIIQSGKKNMIGAWSTMMLITTLYLLILALVLFFSKEHLSSFVDFTLLWITTAAAYPLLYLLYRRLFVSNIGF